jgi:hypothetical protein
MSTRAEQNWMIFPTKDLDWQSFDWSRHPHVCSSRLVGRHGEGVSRCWRGCLEREYEVLVERVRGGRFNDGGGERLGNSGGVVFFQVHCLQGKRAVVWVWGGGHFAGGDGRRV